MHKNSLSLISRDSRTSRNSGTNFNLEGENVTGYRYMIHLYCLAVQAGFYSDAVECRTLSSGPGSIPGWGKILFPFIYLLHSVCKKAPNSVNASKRKHKIKFIIMINKDKQKKVREKSRECHNHKPQPFPDPKRKRKRTNPNKHKPNKRTKSTKISSLFPKRRNRNTKRTEKHKNKMTHGNTYNKSPRRINHKATKSKTNTGTTA